jgi:hypothetical protein
MRRPRDGHDEVLLAVTGWDERETESLFLLSKQHGLLLGDTSL